MRTDFLPFHVPDLDLHPFYRETLHCSAADYPRATSTFDRIISLPLYTRMSEKDQDDVIASVKDILHQK